MKFFLKNGETADVLILDTSFSAGTIIHEHRLRGQDGKFNITEPCIAATHNCPICNQGNKVSKLLLITILDLRGYTRKEPPYEHIPYSRKVLPINFANLQKWQQMIESPALQVGGGSIRGTYLRLCRGMEQTSAAIGDPIPVEGGRLFLTYDEQALNHYWRSPARMDQQGKVVAPEGQSLQAFDYAKVFPAPDIQRIINQYGAVGVGNPAASARDFAQPPPQARGTRTATPPPVSAYGAPPQTQQGYAPPAGPPPSQIQPQTPQSPPTAQPRQYVPQTAAQFAESAPPQQAFQRNPAPPQLPQAETQDDSGQEEAHGLPEVADDGMPFGNG